MTIKVLSVRQPWASAIFNGKPVENRTTNIFGAYRGPVAIHASKTYEEGAEIPVVSGDGFNEPLTEEWVPVDPEGIWRAHVGVIVGVVDLVDAHPGWSTRCGCDPNTGWPVFDQWHGVLDNPRALATPIPFKGSLGLRDLDHAAERLIRAQLPPFCSDCGCTDDNACWPPCSWVPRPEGALPLCSACAVKGGRR